MRTQTISRNETSSATWSAYKTLNPKDAVIFNAVMKGFIGIKSTPTVVSKQVGTVMKYRFKLSVSILSLHVTRPAIIEVFQNENGKLHITRILGL